MIRKYLYSIIWVGLMTYASLTPSNQLPDFILFKHADKVIHFLMYAGLSFFAVPVFLANHKYIRSYLFSVTTSLLIGITFEVLQSLATKTRSGDIYDVLANFLGAISGVVIYHLLIRGRKAEKFLFKI